MAGSFQVVMPPLKIFPRVGPSSTSLSTPGTLYVTAIGPKTTGRFQASEPQRLAAAATSPLSALSGESEPPKSVWLPVNSLTPAPDPFDV